jgi:glycerophosphoryl diester phosphodiesterase
MKNKPLILGHRGYRKKYPENTMLAFKKAYKYGADGIECDVQKTKDGRYIIFHDDELSRITGRKGNVADTTYKIIKKLDAGKGERIPHIDEFLDSLPCDKFINIELKEETLTPADSEAIIVMLEKRSLKDNILISSFLHPLLPLFKKYGYKTGLLFEEEFFDIGIKQALLSIMKHRPWSVNLPVKRLTGDSLNFRMKLFLRIMKLFNVKIIYWTVNTEEQFNEVAPYAHTIITDNVELMVKLQKSRLNEQGVR